MLFVAVLLLLLSLVLVVTGPSTAAAAAAACTGPTVDASAGTAPAAAAASGTAPTCAGCCSPAVLLALVVFVEGLLLVLPLVLVVAGPTAAVAGCCSPGGFIKSARASGHCCRCSQICSGTNSGLLCCMDLGLHLIMNRTPIWLLTRANPHNDNHSG